MLEMIRTFSVGNDQNIKCWKYSEHLVLEMIRTFSVGNIQNI